MSRRGFRRRGRFGRMGLIYKYGVRSRMPVKAYAKPVDCPEIGAQVSFPTCVRCSRFQIWHPKDEIKRCWHEYRELESRGFYDGTYDDHPENFDPETFARLQERKRINEEVNREMELERAELDRKAEELAANSKPSDIYEYYWEHEGEGEEPEEELEQEDEDDEEDYF